MIRMFDYQRLLPELEEAVVQAIRTVLHSGRLIHGPETAAFEKRLPESLGAAHSVGVASGTVALHLALRALDVGPGDEVITVANTCVPTISAIRLCGAVPVLVDVEPDTLMMDSAKVASAITDQTRCILPVHLWGNAVDMDAICEIASAHDLPIIEDCAQAQGTYIRDQHVGTFGNLACFSFYPTKNLGAYGDAGAVVTSDIELADRCRRLRMYGYDGNGIAQEDGMNGRIAEFQSAILNLKLDRLAVWIAQRRSIGSRYSNELVNPRIKIPTVSPVVRHAYHQFVLRCPDRDALQAHLEEHKIQSAIHYPVPIHHMPAYQGTVVLPGTMTHTESAAKEILSIPVHESLTEDEVLDVLSALNNF